MNKADITLPKLQLERISHSPKKKNYDYYKHFGNSWNSKYLSSPKVSKYYIDPHENYISGPNGPCQISLIELTERTKKHEEIAAKSKIESRQRLVDRKTEREKEKARQGLSVSTRRSCSPNRRPNTQNFPVENLALVFAKMNSLNVREINEPVMLTEKNFSVNDAYKKEIFERNTERHESLSPKKRSLFGKKFELNITDYKKNNEDSIRNTKFRKVGLSVDMNKLSEILNELEDFEKEYARRKDLRALIEARP